MKELTLTWKTVLSLVCIALVLFAVYQIVRPIMWQMDEIEKSLRGWSSNEEQFEEMKGYWDMLKWEVLGYGLLALAIIGTIVLCNVKEESSSLK